MPAHAAAALPVRGINYDTGVNYDKSGMSRDFWHPKAVRRDMQVIARDLHCNGVTVFGTKIDRLEQAASFALQEGLDVWIQPRLIEGSRSETLEHLVRTAAVAERLRQQYPDRVNLNIGCELSLFMKGIMPGKNFQVRIYGLMLYWVVMPIFNYRLNAYLRRACAGVRQHFGGKLTYSSGEWEGIDWEPFDFVGMDYYMDANNKHTYLAGLRKLQSHGKPVIITEFGCCSFKGADRKGGGGFMIIKWGKQPTIKRGHVRDERVQADYIENLVQIYQREQVYGAFIYAFSEPRNVHSANPRFDLDMASYGLVKVTRRETATDPETWEPKPAYRRVGRLYSSK